MAHFLEPSVNRNKVRRESVRQLNRKRANVGFSLPSCCERLHFGLVRAGMRGSSSVSKCGV